MAILHGVCRRGIDVGVGRVSGGPGEQANFQRFADRELKAPARLLVDPDRIGHPVGDRFLFEGVARTVAEDRGLADVQRSAPASAEGAVDLALEGVGRRDHGGHPGQLGHHRRQMAAPLRRADPQDLEVVRGREREYR